MNIIGIDPGTACGWAIIDGNGIRIGSGVWNLASRRHEGGGMRYLRCRQYFTELLRSTGHPVMVAYEEVRRHMGTDAAHVYGGIVATIAQVCEEWAVPYSAVPVTAVKKLATGKGRASKEMMMAAAGEQWRMPIESSDEADALWIAETLRQGMQLVAQDSSI